MIGTTLTVTVLAVCTKEGISLQLEKMHECEVREQTLQMLKAEEEERALQLEEKRIYIQTKQYVEQIAKEKLGLVNKDEILLKPDESG